MKIYKHQQKLLTNSPEICRPFLKDSFNRNLGITVEDVTLGDFLDQIDQLAIEPTVVKEKSTSEKDKDKEVKSDLKEKLLNNPKNEIGKPIDKNRLNNHQDNGPIKIEDNRAKGTPIDINNQKTVISLARLPFDSNIVRKEAQNSEDLKPINHENPDKL